MTEVKDKKTERATAEYIESAHEEFPKPEAMDWPSYLYVGLALVNALFIMVLDMGWLLLLLTLLQTGFFVGFLELLNQSAKYNFTKNRLFNDFSGTCAGAFLGINHIAYRQARGWEERRNLCDSADANYEENVGNWSRVFLSLPAHFGLAQRINAQGKQPDAFLSHNKRQRCRDTMVVIYCCMGLFAFIMPLRFVFLYVAPFIFALVLDEAIQLRAGRCAPQESGKNGMADVRAPFFISLLLLGRNCYQTRREQPGLRWFEVVKDSTR